MGTKEGIRRLIEFDPTASNSDIARALDVSRQLVSFHVQKMKGLPKRTPRESVLGVRCLGCPRRITRTNKYRMCRACLKASHTYEFVCAFCGVVNEATGQKASLRRVLDNRYERLGKTKRNFCSIAHANKFNRKLWSRLNKLDRDSKLGL